MATIANTRFYPTARVVIEPYRLDKYLTILRCLCELIDNAFDADARLVQLIVAPGKRFICEDDGRGCDNIQRLIAIGESGPVDVDADDARVLARMFGLGGKAAGIKLTDAGKVTYCTISNGLRAEAIADWARMRETNCCEISDQAINPKEAGEKDGTRITMEPCPVRWNVAELARELGFQYARALGDRRIVIALNSKVHEVRPWESPRLSHEHPIRFEFPGGEGRAPLPVTGRVGLVEAWPDGHGRAGWYGQFAHRMSIFSRTPGAIAGGIGPNLFGEFTLPPGWRNINLTKDGIGRDEDEFWEIVADQSRPVIDLDKKAKAQFDVNNLGEQISEALSDALLGVKERRNRPDPPAQPGTRPQPEEPSGRRRRNLKQVQPGGSVAPTPAGIRAPITFAFERSNQAIWVGLHRATAHIVFSIDSPPMAALQKVDKHNLIQLAALSFCQQVAQEEKQAAFGFEPLSACLAMFDRVMANLRMEDDRPILKIISERG